MRTIDIPIFLDIDEGSIKRIDNILKNANLYFGNVLLIHGAPPIDKIARSVSDAFPHTTLLRITDNRIISVDIIEENVNKIRPEILIAVGGGKTIDPVKMAAARRQIDFITIPTILSHDGIASPVAVINFGNKIKTIGVKMPLGIIVDLNVIKTSPSRGIRAGMGDLISNISAANDWLLAQKYGKEKIDPFALLLAKIPAYNFIKESYTGIEDNKLLRYLAEGLIMSGIAMGIAGSSRPASGSEHLISHALDRILTHPAYHGEQVGIATPFTLYMHDLKEEAFMVMNFYKRMEFPLTPPDIGISRENFLRAVEIAPSTRKGRFTILDLKGKDREYLNMVYEKIYGKAKT